MKEEGAVPVIPRWYQDLSISQVGALDTRTNSPWKKNPRIKIRREKNPRKKDPLEKNSRKTFFLGDFIQGFFFQGTFLPETFFSGIHEQYMNHMLLLKMT